MTVRPTPGDLDSQLLHLEHPHREAIVALTELIRGLGPQVRAGIKWGGPSFAADGRYFATIQLRAPRGVMLVLHFDGKARPECTARERLGDGEGLLTWLAADRAVVRIADGEELATHRHALEQLLRRWLEELPRALAGAH